MANSKDIFPTAVFVGTYRGEISPTVARAFLADPLWFDNTFKDCESSSFDLEGFDKNGYNQEGVDRAGFTAKSYEKNMYYEVNDDHIDAGEERFLEVLQKYSFEKFDGLYLIVQLTSIQACDISESQDYYVYACNETGQINYY